MSNKVWDEERIREEFKRLDSITGLHGADLSRLGKPNIH